MTPKEKAAELVNRYFLSDIDIDWYDCIDCALIAVDEILKNSVGYWAYDGVTGNDIHADDEYWQEVKQEIEKL